MNIFQELSYNHHHIIKFGSASANVPPEHRKDKVFGWKTDILPHVEVCKVVTHNLQFVHNHRG